MIKHIATVAHKPEQGKWGDCFRTTIAAILDIEEVSSVPHFFDNGIDGEAGLRACDEWLSTRGLRLCIIGFDEDDFSLILDSFCDMPVPHIVIGETADGPHCVIAYDGAVLHDVAIVRTDMLKAHCVLIIAASLDVAAK